MRKYSVVFFKAFPNKRYLTDPVAILTIVHHTISANDNPEGRLSKRGSEIAEIILSFEESSFEKIVDVNYILCQ